MIYRRIARRYAAALFRAASDQGTVDQIGQELAAAEKVIAAHPTLQTALAHPEIPLARKEEMLRAVFAGLTPLALTFLALVVQRQRQAYLGGVIEEYQRRADEARGLVRAQVASAIPMTEQQQERLRRALEQRTGKRVEMTCEADAALLAGVVVTMDHEVIDASARGRLAKLRELLAGVRFRGLGQ